MYSMSWQLVAVFLQIHFSISNTILFENIQDHSKKNRVIFEGLDEFYHLAKAKK